MTITSTVDRESEYNGDVSRSGLYWIHNDVRLVRLDNGLTSLTKFFQRDNSLRFVRPDNGLASLTKLALRYK